MEFKNKVTWLIEARKKVDMLIEDKKITKRQYNKIKERISYEWDVAYNRREDIPKSIKQAFNKLYTK